MTQPAVDVQPPHASASTWGRVTVAPRGESHCRRRAAAACKCSTWGSHCTAVAPRGGESLPSLRRGTRTSRPCAPKENDTPTVLSDTHRAACKCPTRGSHCRRHRDACKCPTRGSHCRRRMPLPGAKEAAAERRKPSQNRKPLMLTPHERREGLKPAPRRRRGTRTGRPCAP